MDRHEEALLAGPQVVRLCSMVSQPLYSHAAQTGAACCGSDDAAPTILLYAECQDFVHICEEDAGRHTGSSSRIHRAERNTDQRSNKAQTCYVQVTLRGTSDQIVRWTVKCFDWNALLDCSITCFIWIAQFFAGRSCWSLTSEQVLKQLRESLCVGAVMNGQDVIFKYSGIYLR